MVNCISFHNFSITKKKAFRLPIFPNTRFLCVPMVDKSLLFVRQLIFFSGNCFKLGGELFPTPTGYIRFRKKFRSTRLCGRRPFLHTIIPYAVSAISESVSSGNSRFPCLFKISLSFCCFILHSHVLCLSVAWFKVRLLRLAEQPRKFFIRRQAATVSIMPGTNLSNFAPSNFTNSTKMLFLKKFFHFSLQHSENMVKW